MTDSNRRDQNVASPFAPHMSPDFHRHGLFHPGRSAVSQLAKAPSVVGRIRKEALQPAHRIRTGRPSALPKPHHCCGMFYYFFAALFSSPCRLFFRYPYLSRGEGQDGIGWGQDADVAYLYTRTQNAPPVFPLPPLSELRTQPQYPSSHPGPAAQSCYRPAPDQPSASSHCSRHPQPTDSRQNDLQAILHNHHPTQQKYNFVQFKSKK